MERPEAIHRLTDVINQDLRPLAEQYKVSVFFKENGSKNNIWVNQVLERHLRVYPNSSRSPSFWSWELKVIPLKYLKNGNLTVTRTMFITTIDTYYLKRTDFENSYLHSKLRKMIVAARIWESKREERSILHSVTNFDLDDPEVYRQVKADYDLVRETIQTQGFSAVTGKMGVYIQPKTIVPGHGMDSIVFYARTAFVKKMVLPAIDLDTTVCTA
jgi:DNA mismatch repair protein MutH